MQIRDSNITNSLSVVVAGYIGLYGTAVLAREYKDRIDKYYPGYLSEEAAGYDELSIRNDREIENALKEYIECRKLVAGENYFSGKIAEGGLLTALWNFAKEIGHGFTLNLRDMPIKQETIEICELLEVNPYHLFSKGAYIFALPEGDEFVDFLLSKGINSVVVGRTNDSKAHILNNDGITSHINRPEIDELERLGLV